MSTPSSKRKRQPSHTFRSIPPEPAGVDVVPGQQKITVQAVADAYAFVRECARKRVGEGCDADHFNRLEGALNILGAVIQTAIERAEKPAPSAKTPDSPPVKKPT